MATNLDKKILDGFSREVKSYLPSIREGIDHFQNDSSHHEVLKDTLRYIHTIKGASALMGLMALSQVATYIEELLEDIISGYANLDRRRNQWLVLTIEQIDPYLQGLLNGEGENQEIIEFIESGYRQIKSNSEEVASIKKEYVDENYIEDNNTVDPHLASYEIPPSLEKSDSIVELKDESSVTYCENEKQYEIVNTSNLDVLNNPTEYENSQDNQGSELQIQNSQHGNQEDHTCSDSHLSHLNRDDFQSTNLTESEDVLSEQIIISEKSIESSKELEGIVDAIDSHVRNTYQIADRTLLESSSLASANLSERYLLFTIGKSYYAAAISNILEIARVPPITPVPNVPDWLTGVISLRGEILSVIDLGHFLDVGDSIKNDDNRLLIVSTEKGKMMTSLIVDQINGFIQLTSSHDDSISVIFHDRATPYINGIFEFEGIILATLDLEQFLHSSEICQLY